MNFLRNALKPGGGGHRQPSYTDSFTDQTADDAAYVRAAHHSGSWYPSDAEELDDLLGKYLAAAEDDDGTVEPPRPSAGIPNACISPHAGFRYSGPTAAYSYLVLREALLKNPSLRTVVVLHPSHHVYLDGCAVSGASVIETPLLNLAVDASLREQLLSTNKLFTTMEQHVDEEEHSGEMQYPFIAKIIKDAKMDGGKQYNVRVLPIMVGSIKGSTEEAFGTLLSPYLSDRGIFTVVSSDFCHWGSRFGYTPQPSKAENNVNEVHEYIEYLDKKGMDLISMQRPGAFADYLREYHNTICGRHPISVWLHSLRQSMLTHEVKFVKYDQSEKARTIRDSSVSYASAVCRVAMFDG
ncbi:hypothetical protein ACHAXT_005426 [Thalassiosira profunda]